MSKTKIVTALIVGGFVLSACSTSDIQARDRLNYTKAQQANPLELPPNLANRTRDANYATNVLSEYNKNHGKSKTAGVNVLPNSADVKLVRAGENRWISAKLPAEFVWTQSVQLFQELGLEVENSNPEAGTLESKWMSNRADVPETFLRKLMSGIADQLFSSPTRDKFKLRLEREGDRVLVHVTHYGLKDKASGYDDQYHTWVERPRDPELEAEFLSRLMVKLGGTEGAEVKAQGTLNIETLADNRFTINRPYNSVWLQVGNLFDDGADFRVDELDRGARTYTVLRAAKTKGFFKKTTVYDTYSVVLTEQGNNQTLIEITPKEPNMPVEPLVKKLTSSLY
ncbi:outer membrane protein assembly factor BamC [Ignatzschineria sp. RMDPL8A]|uniref:outer membrane protein assembly factor BamC n=1 Tax=Ignatzschineria sp. RMDPL8A TaxID=2999236 RepID=UPI00244663CC|nr:outer membrane protein assembly factor BamC [Ignatzschineria sp. RMDPL8A]MDG9729958.1 outer membrane protein assembly factor BamC [Ignatzschineria sp. RMDPL8A]